MAALVQMQQAEDTKSDRDSKRIIRLRSFVAVQEMLVMTVMFRLHENSEGNGALQMGLFDGTKSKGLDKR